MSSFKSSSKIGSTSKNHFSNKGKAISFKNSSIESESKSRSHVKQASYLLVIGALRGVAHCILAFLRLSM